MDVSSLIVLLFVAGLVGYCGGRQHGFHKLFKSIGLESEEKNN